ncbi:MAG: DUF2203 family protein [Sphaerobacteraceae bacterium]|nr:MAG: DUF2203 family protein [Sphaerobacteraceae bacterium]
MDHDEPAFLYTVQQARDLIPELRPLIAAMQLERRRLQDEVDRLNDLTPAMQQNGHAVRAANHERMILEFSESLREKLDQFDMMGIDVKDIEHGIIDFPSERDGRVVYLCWHVEEETVSYWHEVHEGYQGRQPLDE